MKGGAEEAMNEIGSLVEELKQFDNPAGYMMKYEEVKKRLDPAMQKIIRFGEDNLDPLHALLLHEETWSCLFALQIMKEIKSQKSIPFLVEFIRRTDQSDYWETGEYAMKALTAIGEPAVEPLLKEVKTDFEHRRFLTYLVGAMTEIKDKRVYEFMVEVIEDFLKNTEKYRGWFNLEMFVYDFNIQGGKEVLPLLRRLLNLDLSEHERIEVIDTIKYIEDPKRYEKETRKQVEKLKPLLPLFARRKIGRNDPCPCGSGKKYKNCCWLKTIGVKT